MKVGSVVYEVSVDYKRFEFGSAMDALTFANTAFMTSTDGAIVKIELVWKPDEPVKEEN